MTRINEIIKPCLYRPLDSRFCILHSCIMDRPRLQFQSNMFKENMALSTTRNVEISRGFEHIFCTDQPMD